MNALHNYQSKPATGFLRFIILLVLALLAMLVLSAFQTNKGQLITDEGERVFNQVCSTCHQLDPPASMENGKPIAPPMKMILRHYQMAFDSSEAVQNALTSWLEAPDKERSVLPAHALEEHGLMPPLTISETERVAVVQYLMTLMSDDDMKGMMKGKMNHDMKGMEGEKNGKMNHDMKGKQVKKNQNKKMN